MNCERVPRGLEHSWWRDAVVYQIYPASFLDSNGDGLGDLQGIISKLDYIQSLGVDAIWLSPIFASPQHDMGYDISDYRTIHPPYGSVEQVEYLIKSLHDRSMRLLMDLVVNHTSSEHAWFKESRSSRSAAKRDWYFWRDPIYLPSGSRQPPNNWSSIFGGSAWHYDDETGQYYLALFLSSQPDLNWANEEMRRAAYDDMRFWLDRGVDGFRIDSMNLMSKHADLPNAEIVRPNDEFQSGEKWFASGPRMHEYIREMRADVFEEYKAMTVGELAFPKDVEAATNYVAQDRRELNMLFTGDVADMDFGVAGKYHRGDFHPGRLRAITDLWQTEMPKVGGWNTIYLENHDSGRSISRYASDAPEHRSVSAKMLATYLCTLSGTLFLLAGQEIGMANMPKDWGVEHYVDVEGRNHYESVLKARGGDASKMTDVLRELRLKARDHGRLPMQWDSTPNAGFTSSSATPWKNVNSDYEQWNVARQLDDPHSVLSYWKRILAVRKAHADIFTYGRFAMIGADVTGENVVAYERCSQDGERKALVVLNFSETATGVEVGDQYEAWRLLMGNRTDDQIVAGRVTLGAFGGVIYCSWLD